MTANAKAANVEKGAAQYWRNRIHVDVVDAVESRQVAREIEGTIPAPAESPKRQTVKQ
jgi:hypothetical protein